MRRSKIALDFLALVGVEFADTAYHVIERNFAAGDGSGRFALPFHIVRMRRIYGDSKETVGYADGLEDARKQALAMTDGHRASDDATEWTYFVRDVRTGHIYNIRR